MDNLKKQLSLLLVLMLALTMMPVSALAAIPDGAPFSAITTDKGDAISVTEEGEVTVMYNTGTLYRVVIPEDATYAAVTLDIALADLMYYTDDAGNPSAIAGYIGSEESEGYCRFGYNAAEDKVVITIPMEYEVSGWSGDATYYLLEGAVAGPEYGSDFSPVCFFTFEYGEAAGGEEPACEHTETRTSYGKIEGSGTHTVTVTCTACGDVSEMVEDCVDINPKNNTCDLCVAQLPCDHPEAAIQRFGEQIAGTETHSVTMVCMNCSTEVGEKTIEDCIDEDADLFCDLCGGEVACKHANATYKYNYASNGDNTHTVTARLKCPKPNRGGCGETVSEETYSEACVDEDNNSVCDLCEGEMTAAAPANPITKLTFWSSASAPITEITVEIGDSVDAIACCTPKATTENVVIFSSSDSEIFTVETEEVTADANGHAPGTIKGVKAGEATLTAVSKTNPNVSAQLKVTVPCNHVGTETTTTYEYEIVGGGVHNTVANVYCACGGFVKTSTSLNDECVDEDANGECDLCKGDVEVPAEDTPALIFDSSIHGAWGSTITFNKLYVSGVKVKSYEWNNGACIVTLSKDTPADAVMTFSVEGLGGGAQGSAAFYVNGSKTNLTAQLENGQAVVEIRAAHKLMSTTQATAKNVSFITEGDELVPVESIVITPENPRVVANSSLQLTATVYPENATVKDVKWSTSAASTNLTINETGKVMGHTMGMGGYYTVTATSVSNPEVSASCKVFLDWKPEDSIVLNKETMTVKIGEPDRLSATVSGSNFVTNTAVTWSSSDESVATVDSGNVTGLKTGTAIITATSYYGLTASCEVTVTCGHVGMDTTMVYTQIEGAETHTAATTCVCGYELGSSTENCEDENKDGVCDLCGGAVSVEAPETKPGDLNGDGEINVKDISNIKLHITGKKSLDESQMAAADVNGDGEINVKDVSKIKLHITGKKPLF